MSNVTHNADCDADVLRRLLTEMEAGRDAAIALARGIVAGASAKSDAPFIPADLGIQTPGCPVHDRAEDCEFFSCPTRVTAPAEECLRCGAPDYCHPDCEHPRATSPGGSQAE